MRILRNDLKKRLQQHWDNLRKKETQLTAIRTGVSIIQPGAEQQPVEDFTSYPEYLNFLLSGAHMEALVKQGLEETMRVIQQQAELAKREREATLNESDTEDDNDNI
jgi:hypothetical protein